jgi:ASC-1-like (ASCH) protein
MSTFRLPFRFEDKKIFLMIKNHSKSVETRAGNPNYLKIKAGDILKFSCGSSSFQRKVKRVKVFKSIQALLKKHPLKSVDPSLRRKTELEILINSFPNYKERIKKYGIIAFEI